MKLQTNIYRRYIIASLTALTAFAAAVAPAGTVESRTRILAGDSVQISGRDVTAWAEVTDGQVSKVGLTLPFSAISNPPTKPGTGPCGAIAVLKFPDIVGETTFINHFEMQWNPHGHPPACCFGVPHFDLHFYGVPVEDVFKVGFKDPIPVEPDRVPVGWMLPPDMECIPQMGVHAAQVGTVVPGHVMNADMIAGFYHGQMTFIEPMVSQAFLLRKKDFTCPVPMPKKLGKATRFPTTFTAHWDAATASYKMWWGGFQNWDK